ncbi:MAG TPA: hypothetical protein VGN42_16405 [Pirellulales bacterium]|jgi:hypothetical protein|nr:hypothetical protein [Pirellulales bacterium]
MSAEDSSRLQFTLAEMLATTTVVALTIASVARFPEWLGAPVMAFVGTASAAVAAMAAIQSKGKRRAFYFGAAFPLFLLLIRTSTVLLALVKGVAEQDLAWPQNGAWANAQFAMPNDPSYIEQRFFYRWEALSALTCAPLIGLISVAFSRISEPQRVVGTEQAAEESRRRYWRWSRSLAVVLLLIAIVCGLGLILRVWQTESWDRHDGRAVVAAGSPVLQSTRLAPGDKVLVEQAGSWWRGRVKQTLQDGSVLIRYVGWDASWDEVVPRSRLQSPIGP